MGFSIGILASEPETIQCRIDADSWVGMHRWEARSDQRRAALENHGGEEELVIQGRISFALLHFDMSAAKGMTVTRATLRFRRKDDPVPLHTVGLSTISGSGPWVEATVNFFQPASDRFWSYPDSDLTDVTFAQGGSLYSYERVRGLGEGWWEVDVPPQILHSLLIQDQFGLMLSDEKGQTQTTHHIYSRESSFPPSLTIEGTRVDQTSPGEVLSEKSGAVVLSSTPDEARQLGRTGLRPGSVILRFGSAGDDRGEGTASRYDLWWSQTPIHETDLSDANSVERWCLNPLAPRSDLFSTLNHLGDSVTVVVEELEPGKEYFFAARATDEAGNKGPLSSLGRYTAYDREYPSLPPPEQSKGTSFSFHTASDIQVWAIPDMLKLNPQTGDLVEELAAARGDYRYSNAVWDASSATVRLFGSRNEFVAFQLVVETDRPLSDVKVTMEKTLFQNEILPEVFRQTGAIQMYREWFVPDDRDMTTSRGWYPDPLVPFDGTLEIPSRDNAVPGQRVQPVFVDVYIPRTAEPGKHFGEISVETTGKTFPVRIELEVLPIELPDELNFLVDLNCYGGVNSGWDLERGTPDYRRLEHAYHRLAHLHRTNLDVLGYSHNGSTTADHAPPLEGEGAETKVSSWADWDAHFSPILGGSLFADLPRVSQPVPVLYLPFFENWPGSLRKGYKYDDPAIPASQEEYQELITRHALEAEPIQLSFSRSYQDRYRAVIRQFADHILENGWTRTRFTVYLNNKYYWKRPSQGGRGISWWLMDEPNHRDDVLAAVFFGYLTKDGLEGLPEVPILFRTDISRVEWIRDLMPDQIDLNCISRRFFEKNRYLLNDRPRFGKEYWNYATSNHPRESNVAMRAWCWRVYLSGGDGLLPWNAVRGARAWERAEQLTVFYPGNKFGVQEPFASMRLKAYRRGQQDIEYLIQLANQSGWDRDAVTYAASRALDLAAEIKMDSSEDAGQMRFQKVTNSDLEELRRRVARALVD